jgi:ABC-type amino acid transport substrate-binding protein
MKQTTIAWVLCVSWAAAASGADLAEVKQARKLRVAAAIADLPFERDVLQGFARSIGVELAVEPVGSRGAALQAVAAGRADLAAGGLVVQRDRLAGLAFSADVFPTRVVAVNRAPAEAPGFIESLRGASRILAPASTGAAQVARDAKLPESKTESGSAERAIDALRADTGAVALLGLFDALVARRADPALQVGVALGPREGIGFAVREADGALRAALDGHVQQLRASPSYRLVIGRGLGEDALRILSRAHLE